MFIGKDAPGDSGTIVSSPADEHDTQLGYANVGSELDWRPSRLGKVAVAFLLDLSRQVLIGVKHEIVFELYGSTLNLH